VISLHSFQSSAIVYVSSSRRLSSVTLMYCDKTNGSQDQAVSTAKELSVVSLKTKFEGIPRSGGSN